MRKFIGFSVMALAVFLVSTAETSSCSSTTGTSSPAAPDKSPAAAAAASPAPAHTTQVLLDIQGSGAKQTQKFTAASDWDAAYTFDCSNFGQSGNFQWFVYDGDGTISFDNPGPNQLAASGNDVQHYHKGGTYYLSINSECNWTVKVTG